MSMHGEVKVWKMTEEERQEYIKRYPPKIPLNSKKQVTWAWQRLTKQRYEEMRYKEGLNDSEIIDALPWLSYSKLRHLKKEWASNE